ncbi:MAG TPA: SET domain-containing protein [Candidatus Paceibacterota bacterium]|nr:SET domain-containing protein [Candidatus Paceibacterota bacterium]
MKSKLIFVLRPVNATEIGIFATEDIPAGTYLPLFVRDDYRLMRTRTLERLPGGGQLALYCVKDSSGYHAPSNFNRMSIGWYIRHSDQPSCEHRNYTFFAARDIRAWEEITIDFEALGDERYS